MTSSESYVPPPKAQGRPALLIVDPIFRGSRLFYSWMMAQALQDRFNVHVVTRTAARTQQFADKFADMPVTLHEVLRVPDDFWFAVLQPQQVATIVKAIVDLDRSLDVQGLYFAGLNEVFPHVLRNLIERTDARLRAKPMTMVEYDAAFLLSDDGDAPGNVVAMRRQKRARLWLAKKHLPGLRIGILDERAFDSTKARFRRSPFARRTFFPLPDPLPDQDRHTFGTPAVQNDYFVTGSVKKKILVVGIQSKRKGLADIVGAARADSSNRGDVRFFLSGQLDRDTEGLRPDLLACADQIAWRDRYVSEDEIRRSYAACDYVALPYAKGFEGSSGVFAYAMAFGKPVVATAHGCIGHRVASFGLGFTYRSGDVAALTEELGRLPKPDSRDYALLRDNCLAYARANSMSEHQAALVRSLGLGAGPSKPAVASFALTSPPAPSGVPSNAEPPMPSNGFPRRSAVKRIPLITLLDTSIATQNMGDHIIMDAVRRVLGSIFEMACYVTAPTHDYIEAEAMGVARRSDYTFVCGTNLLASHMDQYKQWRITLNHALKMRPAILLGVGWWQYQEAPNVYSQTLLQRILSPHHVHSTRDSYTKDKLAGIGIDNVVNTSCPTTWLLTDEVLGRVPRERGEAVVATLTDYKPDAENDRHLFQCLRERYKRVFMWVQGSKDFEYCAGIVDDDVELIPPTLEAYDRLLGSDLKLDFVGTRLHAGIRALQFSRRATILAVDNRATEIQRDTRLPVVMRGDRPALEAALDELAPVDMHVPFDAVRQWAEQFR